MVSSFVGTTQGANPMKPKAYLGRYYHIGAYPCKQILDLVYLLFGKMERFIITLKYICNH
jgi:hypothetical protein